MIRLPKNYSDFAATRLAKSCQIGVGRKVIGSNLFGIINPVEIRLFTNLHVGIVESLNMALILHNLRR